MRLSNLVFFAIILLLFTGCGSDKKEEKETTITKEDVLLGKWDAQWIKTDPEEGFTGRQLKMNGRMEFTKNRVNITVYGFDGCIFFSDTVVSKLKWKIEDNVIRFIDLSDDQGLPYNIESFSNDKIKLSLMEDIYIDLEKVN